MPRLVALPGETAQNDAALARSPALAVQYDLSQPLPGHRQVQRRLHCNWCMCSILHVKLCPAAACVLYAMHMALLALTTFASSTDRSFDDSWP